MYARVDAPRLPKTVPRKVGPPPIRPATARKRRLGLFESEVRGPAMPNPSVALCAARSR